MANEWRFKNELANRTDNKRHPYSWKLGKRYDSGNGDERNIEDFTVVFELRCFLVTQSAHVLSDLGTSS